MSRYDFQNDLSGNTSTGILLSRIPKNGTVLEFGCATGRMTRYMKENLNCKVYIVEYDRDAFEIALQYAEDGLCGDIQTFEWVERFGHLRFDAIIFADVLEHLSIPELVLEKAASLLGESGLLCVTVPNVTHNDVLLKAYTDHVDYTKTGILDDTHVHFWGLENIKQLSGVGGLTLRRIEGTYCGTGETEQQPEMEIPLLLDNLLRERRCGEIYQFVAFFDRGQDGETEVVLQKPSIRSHLYVDTGRGFNSDQIVAFSSGNVGEGRYRVYLKLDELNGVKRLRLDPIEHQGGILRNLIIRQGDEEIPLIYHNGEEIEEGILYDHIDPMFCVEVERTDEPLIIDGEMVLAGSEYMTLLTKNYRAAKEQSSLLKKRIADADKERMAAEQKCEELERDIWAYTHLANQKEMERIAMAAELQTLNDRIRKLEGYLWPFVKTKKLMSRVLRALKRRIKRLRHEK